MNSMDVTLKNYQIISKAELSFIPGLNVIIGPSNNGKSSILKGIKALLYTVPGTMPIKQGETSYIIRYKLFRSYRIITKRNERICICSRPEKNTLNLEQQLQRLYQIL